jgi:ABC-type branched-subunit amino acid transport system ATPase component
LLCQNNEEKIKQVLNLIELNKPLNSLVYELSYGQKKLIGLAMALIKKHKILLLDEPVAGVNPLLKNKIKEILLKLRNNGETIFLIEHDMNFIRQIADEIIVLDNGKILDKGSFEKIMKNKQVVKTFTGVE